MFYKNSFGVELYKVYKLKVSHLAATNERNLKVCMSFLPKLKFFHLSSQLTKNVVLTLCKRFVNVAGTFF